MNGPVTLEQAKAMVVELGGRVCQGACWEDNENVYASSVETCGPSTYNHPRFEVQYHKSSGWLSRTGLKPVRLEVGR
jgi:hypothetical protein